MRDELETNIFWQIGEKAKTIRIQNPPVLLSIFMN